MDAPHRDGSGRDGATPVTVGRRAGDGWAHGFMRCGTSIAALLTLGLLGGVTAAVFLAGGAPNTLVHGYYIPIVYAAVRFSPWGGPGTALAAGLLSGPLMPAVGGGVQPASSWAVRILFFLVVAVVVRWLAVQQPRPVDVMISDSRTGLALRRAAARDELDAHFQPIVRLSSGQLVGVEALCRWPDGRGGFRSPAVFIPVAERTGAIGPVGARMLRITSARAGAWARAVREPPLVTVNISAVQLADSRFLGDLARALEVSGVRPERFCIEVTETALVDDPAGARAVLSAVRRMGVVVALDDFGTGHSSLAYLKDFPIDIVKIDKSFVDDVDRDPKANALVVAIIEMARALGATTIAEGVERQTQLESLRAVGCELGQGWHLGHPVPWEQVVHLAEHGPGVPRPGGPGARSQGAAVGPGPERA